MLTPEESLRLITQTIDETKEKFKESGHIFVFWGILIFTVTLTQFIFIQTGLKNYTGWPCFLYPLGGFYMYAFFRKRDIRNNTPKTVVGSMITILGAVLGVNFMILGFFFYDRLGDALFPFYLIVMAFWIILIGTSIKFKPIVICGFIVNIIGFVALFFEWQYQLLFMSLAAVIGFIIPGLLFIKAKSQDDV